MLTLDLSMDEILGRWPVTIGLFLEYRMACVGCSMSSFDTLRDALKAYDLPQDVILHELNIRVMKSIPTNGKSL